MIKVNDFDITTEMNLSSGRRIYFVFLSLLTLLIITYGNSLSGAWVFDDEPNIVLNKYIHVKSLDWESLRKTFYGIDQKRISRPIAYFTFSINYYFGHLDTRGYHIVNLFIHFTTGIFLFLFIYRTLNLPRLKTEYEASSYSIALLATFFWVANPVNVTAVTYIVQRMASMAGMFYIISMYFYLLGRIAVTAGRKISFFLFCILAAVFAMGTKENAVMLPVSIFVYDLLLIKGVSRQSLVKSLKFIIIPSLIIISLALLFFIDIYSFLRLGDYAIRPFTMGERLLTETRVIVFYISLLLYPVSSRLMLNHDFTISRSLIEPWTTMAAIIFILGCVTFAFALAKKKPLFSFCILFFFLNHVIEGSIIPLELVFEHTNYIPSMLFFVPLAIFLMRALEYFSYKKAIQWSAALLISFLLFAQGHTVHIYNFLFKEPYLLWKDNIEKAPNLSRPYNNLGNLLWKYGLYEEAYVAYKKSYQLNRYDILPMVAAPINNMGRYYFFYKDYTQAMSHFQTAIVINPNYPLTWMNIVRTQVQMNDLEGAMKTVHQALARWQDNAQLHGLHSFILLKQGVYGSSIREAWKTLVLDGEVIDVMRVLGEAYRRKGQHERAVTCWEQYVDTYQNDLEGHLALIELYAKTGQKEKLDRTVARVMLLKGAKNWKNVIDEYTSDAASHAFVPDKRSFLSIIKKHLLKDF